MPGPKPITTLSAAPMPNWADQLRSRTLFDIEESLILLGEAIADADELTPELQADFDRYLGTARDKRDNVARFRSECESQVEAAKKEIATLGKRKKRFERKIERLDAMLLAVFAAMQAPSLEGYFYTLTKVRNPASVDVLDLEAVSDEYKRVSVCLPAEDWKYLLEAIPADRRQEIVGRLFKHEESPELADMRPVLQREQPIPGARLKTQEYRVEIR